MKSQAVRFYLLMLLTLVSVRLHAAQPDQRTFDQQKLDQERADHGYISDIQKKEEERKEEKKDKEKEEKDKASDNAAQEEKDKSVPSFKFPEIPVWLVYTVAFVLLAILLAVLFNMSISSPFSSREKKEEEIHAEQENIHDIDFNKSIQDALNNGDYRKAIRLYYLLSLKLLSEKKLIDWQSHKTNREYIRELRSAELKYKLEEVTYMFELIWYGEVEMNKNVFEEILAEVKALHQSIKAIR